MSFEKRQSLLGAIDVLAGALRGVLTAVESTHGAIARRPFAVLRRVPATAPTSEAVRGVHDGITGLVYASVRTAIGLGSGAARVAASVAPLRESAAQTGSRTDMAIAALNGFAGERLAALGNPLATTMSLRHESTVVPLDRAALAATYANASGRLAIFVHGLACNEHMWRVHSERHYGAPAITYGSRLQAELGYTPLYVRYNTGLHISQNGRELAALLDRLHAEWPVAVEEIVLVGHSMGGLVVRSACHYGEQGQQRWIPAVRHVFTLGSPHTGAPLEKAANCAAWALGLSDITRPLADVINSRSAGIKDLRYGSVIDEHWRDADVDALLHDCTTEVPLLAGANHYFIAAGINRDARHPIGRLMGDLLVREGSAFGRSRTRRMQFPLENGHRFGAMNHIELLNHPNVYDQIRRWLALKRQP